MNTNLDFDLIVYGAMLAGLGVLAQRLAPDFGHGILITGIAGGLASVFLGAKPFTNWNSFRKMNRRVSCSE